MGSLCQMLRWRLLSDALSTRMASRWANLVEVPFYNQGQASLLLVFMLAWFSTGPMLVIEWSSSRDLLCQEPNEGHHSRPPLLACPPVNNAICILRRAHPEQLNPLQWTNTPRQGLGIHLTAPPMRPVPEEADPRHGSGSVSTQPHWPGCSCQAQCETTSPWWCGSDVSSWPVLDSRVSW